MMEARPTPSRRQRRRRSRRRHARSRTRSTSSARQPAVADRSRHSASCSIWPQPVVAHPRPGREARQPALARDAAAELRRRPRPAPRRSRAGRARARIRARPARRRRSAPWPSDSFGRMRSGCQPLRHSSPMVGFCVQRIGVMREVAGDADVAADAFADVLEPALLDLLRQERIGDRGPRRADQVEDARADLRTMVSGEVKRPTPTTGLVVSCLTPAM